MGMFLGPNDYSGDMGGCKTYILLAGGTVFLIGVGTYVAGLRKICPRELSDGSPRTH